MIERHVAFDVLQGQETAFEQFFIREYKPAMSRMAGFVRVELLRDQEDPSKYQMAIRFNSTEDATAWRASAEHQALSPQLKVLYSKSQVQVYSVIA